VSGVSVRVQIERLVAGGDGLGREPDGRIVFVPGVVPGEAVEVTIARSRKDVAFAQLERVVEPGPVRVEPPCAAHARGCGGCDWQHIDAAAQLGLKLEIVREALRRTARMPEAEVVAGGSVPPWDYRTSMRFAVDEEGRLSLRRARSNDTVDVEGCLIAHPLLASTIRESRVPGAEEVSVRVGVASGEVSLSWSPEAMTAERVPPGAAVGPDAVVHERIAGVEFRVSAASFFQSGPAAAELLVATVRDVAGDVLATATEVVDAYGGVGLFAATVVPVGAHVVLVEGSPAACADARHNLAARSARVIRSAVERWRPSPADVVIADPSRDGLGPAAVRSLVSTRARTLVLISCDPVAFARDASLLRAEGYDLTRSVVLDLFPQTHHVEVVTRFDKRHT
jgi:23S rRNA (uracil1939-C5)-methyltransferase